MTRAPYVHYLDGWRGLAILFLLIGHFFPVPGINLGHLGVNFFFVLSGLLMARLLFVYEVPFGEFYQRRISRIFPTVIVFLVLLVAERLLTGGDVPWREVAAAAAFVNNYFINPNDPGSLPVGHIWSLSVEEHSYILLSLMALAARRRIAAAPRMVGASALALAAIAIFYNMTLDGPELQQSALHTEVAAFGIFASGACLLFLRGRKLPALPLLTFAGMVGVAMAMHWWSVPMAARTVAGVGLLALAVNLLPAAPAFLHRMLSLRPLRQLGLWSFSLYIWQQPFYMLSGRGELPVLAGLALALTCGLASFYLVERPARRWLNGWWDARAQAAIAAEAPSAG